MGAAWYTRRRMVEMVYGRKDNDGLELFSFEMSDVKSQDNGA
jgi:hypothetical protein